MTVQDGETRGTLLERLRLYSSDSDWEIFYQRYAPVVLSFAAKYGLGPAAAHEVLQETMIALMGEMSVFVYDRKKGRFHNYLCTITLNRIRAEKRRNRYDRQVSLDGAATEDGRSPLESLEDSSVSLPEEEIDRQWRHSMWEAALARILADPKYEAHVKAVFREYVLEDVPAATVAAKHGLAVNNVYQIKNRILKDLAAEVERLTRPADRPPTEAKEPRRRRS